MYNPWHFSDRTGCLQKKKCGVRKPKPETIKLSSEASYHWEWVFIAEIDLPITQFVYKLDWLPEKPFVSRWSLVLLRAKKLIHYFWGREIFVFFPLIREGFILMLLQMRSSLIWCVILSNCLLVSTSLWSLLLCFLLLLLLFNLYPTFTLPEGSPQGGLYRGL